MMFGGQSTQAPGDAPDARLYNLLLFVSCWGVLLTFSAASQAAVPASASAGSLSLDQSAYSAHEGQGSLSITIERTGDLSRTEHVGYGVKRQDAQPEIDFHPISNTYITMASGQATYTFSVPIIDQGMNATAVHAVAYLYGSGSWPDSLGANPAYAVMLAKNWVHRVKGPIARLTRVEP